MGFKQIKEYVPAFYHRFLPPFFEMEIPAEVFTKCGSCPMTAASREEMDHEISKPFAPDTKCCTFIPRIPNYFAGAVFTDPEMETGRELLRSRIREKRGIFTQGIYPDKKYRLLYEYGRKNGFGKSSLLRCPYYVQGEFNCSLWKYRESICATWFCKYLGGEAGRDFWNEMRDLFKGIQEKLTIHAIQEMGLTVVPPFGDDEHLTYEDLDDLPMNRKEYQLRWQKWEGREEDFYINCFELMVGIQKVEFNQILGQDYVNQLKVLEEKYHRMVTIPERLKVNPDYKFEELIPGKYRLKLNSYIDRNDTMITYAFDVPRIVIDGFRDHKKTDRVLKELSEEYGVDLGKDMVIALYQHGILFAGK
jgi:hypothetical protein